MHVVVGHLSLGPPWCERMVTRIRAPNRQYRRPGHVHVIDDRRDDSRPHCLPSDIRRCFCEGTKYVMLKSVRASNEGRAQTGASYLQVGNHSRHLHTPLFATILHSAAKYGENLTVLTVSGRGRIFRERIGEEFSVIAVPSNGLGGLCGTIEILVGQTGAAELMQQGLCPSEDERVQHGEVGSAAIRYARTRYAHIPRGVPIDEGPVRARQSLHEPVLPGVPSEKVEDAINDRQAALGEWRVGVVLHVIAYLHDPEQGEPRMICALCAG
jgi:hypothetical protein